MPPEQPNSPVPPANVPAPGLTPSPVADAGQPTAVNQPVVAGGQPVNMAKPPANIPWLKIALFGGGGLLILVILIVVVVVFANQGKVNTQTVFNNALANSLATTSLTKQISDESGDSETVTYDFSNAKDPRISTAVSSGTTPQVVQSTGYGSLKNTYVTYKQFSSDQSTVGLKPLLGKVVQVRANGAFPADADPLATLLNDPRYLLFGDFVFGGFSASDRAKLIQTVTSGVYTFKPSQVQRIGTSKTNETFVFTVKENTDKLRAFEKQVAAVYGLSPDDIGVALDQLGNTQSATVYVAYPSQRITKVVLEQAKRQLTISYNYTAATVPAEPKADLSWDGFNQQLTQLLVANKLTVNPLNTTGLADALIRDVNTERRSDVNAIQTQLEAYYTTNSYYPTLSDMNNQQWEQTNFPGVSQDIFKDPEGNSYTLSAVPTIRSYAYQPLADDGKSACDNQAIACHHYKLIAVLSNGKPYVLNSFN